MVTYVVRVVTHVLLKFGGLSCMALAPTESGSVGAGGHTRTNGVPVEGLLTLGLSELYNERRDGVQALDRRCRSLQVDVDRL